MIITKTRDMNRSRDVEGPELERSYDQEKPMANMKSSADSTPVGTIEKVAFTDLHSGDHEAPLTAMGQEDLCVTASMGSDSADHKPVVSKGSATTNQSKK